MAKKNRDDAQFNMNEQENEGIGSKIMTALILLAIILIWLGVFALLIKFDVGSFGSSVLRPILKDVPVVNRILPAVPDAQLAEENAYPYTNLEEAVAVIKKLETQVNSLEKSGSTKDVSIEDMQKEIERLKVFEENQIDFEKRVKDFETNVVFNDKAPDIKEYQQYYEGIDPTHAEELYKQVIQQQQADKDIKNQADRFAAMKPEEAAPILSVMTQDLDLVCDILKNMRAKQSGAIIAKMDSTIAAKITKKMSIIAE